MKKTDVIIIGSGIAALQLARHLQDHFYVMIITKDQLISSNSYLAQGGIAAPIGENDHVELHYKDTLKAGCYHQAEHIVKELIMDGKRVVTSLVKEGAPFDKKEDGSLSLGMEGAHSVNRILHSGGDQTGKYLVKHLVQTLTDKVEMIEGETVFELLKNKSGHCCGVKTKNERNEIHHFFAPRIVLATGGIGSLYSSTSNHPSVTGDGMALAFLAGAKLSDLEFIQFHPTLLYLDGKTHGLISEAVRGEGAWLVNHLEERIMEGIDSSLELAPRHIVAERIFQERQAGREVFLDTSRIQDFTKKFPSITSLCMQHNIAIEEGKIPVSPGCHFIMGGVVTDDIGRTNVEGLYAIGEVACSGIHGANRLASNSLLEGLVYGERLANYFIENEKNTLSVDLTHLEQRKIENSVSSILFKTEELKKMMLKRVGIIRDEKGLRSHLEWLKAQSLTFNENIEEYGLEEIKKYLMWVASLLVTQAALIRTESRGGHIRSDFPLENNKKWYKRKIILQKEDNQLRVMLNEQNEIKVYA